MMITANAYAEDLKGKDAAELLEVIRRLKREINRRRKTIEAPSRAYAADLATPEEVACLRTRLEAAKAALAETGGEYIPTAAERRAMAFDEGIGQISALTFLYRDRFGSWLTYHIAVEDTLRYETAEVLGQNTAEHTVDGTSFSREEFLFRLSKLHLGEWHRQYAPDRFAYSSDGIRWRLTIAYQDGRKPFSCGGHGAYPYNFDQLVELVGAADCLEEMAW